MPMANITICSGNIAPLSCGTVSCSCWGSLEKRESHEFILVLSRPEREGRDLNRGLFKNKTKAKAFRLRELWIVGDDGFHR